MDRGDLKPRGDRKRLVLLDRSSDLHVSGPRKAGRSSSTNLKEGA